MLCTGSERDPGSWASGVGRYAPRAGRDGWGDEGIVGKRLAGLEAASRHLAVAEALQMQVFVLHITASCRPGTRPGACDNVLIRFRDRFRSQRRQRISGFGFPLVGECSEQRARQRQRAFRIESLPDSVHPSEEAAAIAAWLRSHQTQAVCKPKSRRQRFDLITPWTGLMVCAPHARKTRRLWGSAILSDSMTWAAKESRIPGRGAA